MSVGQGVIQGAFKMQETSRVISRNVRALRKRQALSMRELATRSGLSRSAVASIESGKNNPLACTVWQLAQGLGVPLTRLFVDVDELKNRSVNHA